MAVSNALHFSAHSVCSFPILRSTSPILYLETKPVICTMKLNFLFIPLLTSCLVTNLFSQSKWQFGLNFSPDICYRQLINHSGDPMLNSFIAQRNEQETFRVTYTAGLGALYNINDKWGIETGLYFSDKGFQNTAVPITTSTQPDGTGDFAYSTFHYLYLEIPVKLNMNLPLNKKTALIGGIGIGNNLYLSNYSEMFLGNNGKYTTLGHNTDNSGLYNPYFISGLISLGIARQFNEQLSMRIEPLYRAGISSIVDAPIHCRLNSVGLNFGLWLRG